MPFPYPILKTTLVICTAVSNPKQLKENLQLSNPFTLSSNIKITLKKSFGKIKTSFREPLILPKTIPLYVVEKLLASIYKEHSAAHTSYRKKRTLLDIAICETLFSTGVRISELCNLRNVDVDLNIAAIRIYGKGSKERIIQIGSKDVLILLENTKQNSSLKLITADIFLQSQRNPAF